MIPTLMLAVALAGAAEAAPAPPKVRAGGDGFALESDDGAFRLRLSGYVQADGRFFPGDGESRAADTFLLRRARPILSGTLGRVFEFTVMPDFGGGTAVIQDAWLDARFSPKARLRAGRFKPPFGLERLHSATELLFVERALPSNLAPIRDMGVQFHGEAAGGVVAYAVGVFNGAADGASIDADLSDGKDIDGRVFVRPFRNVGGKSVQALGIGVAGTTGEQEGALPVFRTPGQVVFFNYLVGAAASGTRSRIAPQASWTGGRVRLLGEYVRSQQDVRKDLDTFRVSHDAWQAAAAVLLTGESYAPGPLSPKRPFERGGGRGALEIAARYSELDVDDAVFDHGLADPARSASRARAVAAGLNWYLTRNVKYVADFERTTFEGGSAAGDRDAENAILFRFQLSF